MIRGTIKKVAIVCVALFLVTVLAARQPQQPQAASIDVTEQIKKLGELRDQGLLTEQEFDSKKQELLARM